MSSEDLKPKRKTRTSSEVKNRYKAKTYTRLVLDVRKEKAGAYKAKCAELGIPYSAPLQEAIDRILDQ